MSKGYITGKAEHSHLIVPDMMESINRPPEVRLIQVVEVKHRRGEGCCEDDLCREVTTYYDLDGNVLAENDPTPTRLPEGRLDDQS